MLTRSNIENNVFVLYSIQSILEGMNKTTRVSELNWYNELPSALTLRTDSTCLPQLWIYWPPHTAAFNNDPACFSHGILQRILRVHVDELFHFGHFTSFKFWRYYQIGRLLMKTQTRFYVIVSVFCPLTVQLTSLFFSKLFKVHYSCRSYKFIQMNEHYQRFLYFWEKSFRSCCRLVLEGPKFLMKILGRGRQISSSLTKV